MSQRGSASSSSSREPVLGHPRAVRAGNHAFVANTTAGPAEGAAAAAHARETFGRADSDSVSTDHGEDFRDMFPVTTVVEAGVLAAAGLLVEMKADVVPQ